MNEFITRIEDAISRHGLLQKGDSVLVAVSGGLDSMVLLRTLHALSATQGWKLAVGHFNHLLRGTESNADERFVAKEAKKLRVPIRSARADVMKLAREKKLSVEMAARALRHEFLARTAAELGFHKIALAHHADDQVELFFIRLFRGAGTQGLGGMAWSSPSPANESITLLRPLLGESKASLDAYAHSQNVSFREDSSNLSNGIQRNRIRNKLLPLLRRDFQPQLDGAVLRSMGLVHDDGEFVTVEAIRWLKSRRATPVFNELHIALQRRIVQIELLTAGVIPQFEHVELLRSRADEWISISAGLLCRRTPAGKIEAKTATANPPLMEDRQVDLGNKPNQIEFGSLTIGWSFLNSSKIPLRRREGVEYFDSEAVGPSIVLRHWRNGDRFQPIGMERAAKLQDLFVNQKIPRAFRHQLAIATTAGGEIFWVQGLRLGERFKVTSATKRLLRWSWR